NLAVIIAGVDVGQGGLRLDKPSGRVVEAIARVEDHTDGGEVALEGAARAVAEIAAVVDTAEVRLERSIREEAGVQIGHIAADRSHPVVDVRAGLVELQI